MSGNPKFAILEKDSIEYGYPTEYVPEAADIWYDTNEIETVWDRINGFPNKSIAYSYTGGEVDGFTIYKTNTQTAANKVLTCSLTFTGDLLTSETYVEYVNEVAGRTITYTHSYSGDDVQTTTVAFT